MPVIEKIPKAFISYAREDAAIANAVAKDLRAKQIDVWIDREGLIAGTPDWEVLVREAVAESFGVVLIATPSSRLSAFVQSELLLAEANGRPIYPLWAAGEKWIDAIPLGLSRTQYYDIRGDAYAMSVANLAAVFAEQGFSLPPHFLYRNFYQVHSQNTRPPRGLRERGTHYGNPLYCKLVPDQYMVVDHMGWPQDHSPGATSDAILFRPSAYPMAAHLLDQLYIHYLADRFPAYTYGTSWVLCAGWPGLQGIVAIDARWVHDGNIIVPESNIAQHMIASPERYNLIAGQTFSLLEEIPDDLTIVAANDPWVTGTLIRYPKGNLRLIEDVLEFVPATQINLDNYPFVAVCSSVEIMGGHDQILVQRRKCTWWIKARIWI